MLVCEEGDLAIISVYAEITSVQKKYVVFYDDVNTENLDLSKEIWPIYATGSDGRKSFGLGSF